jgi:signal transduction histidine kinase
MTDRERGLVFQKYYQAESPSKGISKAPKGTGLGLAICKEIIEHYQGMIGVDPGTDGNGSSFYFRLPLLED